MLYEAAWGSGLAAPSSGGRRMVQMLLLPPMRHFEVVNKRNAGVLETVSGLRVFISRYSI